MLTNPSTPLRARPQSAQRGLSMLESLIALLVLALGIMGLAGVQTRMIVENRSANNRAVAIGLIDDLTNRILLNRDAAVAGSYALAWDATSATQDCVTATCSGAQLAQSDLNIWRANVLRLLPGANATVFASTNDGRQLGIAVAWQANEGKAADTDSTTYKAPFAVTAANSGVACPANSLCQVVYVQP